MSITVDGFKDLEDLAEKDPLEAARVLRARADLVDEQAPGPYGYERIIPPNERPHFRVCDANDDRIATCYSEGHAKLVVRLMNRGLSATS